MGTVLIIKTEPSPLTFRLQKNNTGRRSHMRGFVRPNNSLMEVLWSLAAAVFVFFTVRHAVETRPCAWVKAALKSPLVGLSYAEARAVSRAFSFYSSANVLQAWILPCSNPRLNQLTRCAELPCVKPSGTT